MSVKPSGEEDLCAIANVGLDHRIRARAGCIDREILTTGCNWYNNLNSQVASEREGSPRDGQKSSRRATYYEGQVRNVY